MEALRERYNQFIIDVVYNEEVLNNPAQLGVIDQFLGSLEAFRNETEQLKVKAYKQYA